MPGWSCSSQEEQGERDLLWPHMETGSGETAGQEIWEVEAHRQSWECGTNWKKVKSSLTSGIWVFCQKMWSPNSEETSTAGPTSHKHQSSSWVSWDTLDPTPSVRRKGDLPRKGGAFPWPPTCLISRVKLMKEHRTTPQQHSVTEVP